MMQTQKHSLALFLNRKSIRWVFLPPLLSTITCFFFQPTNLIYTFNPLFFFFPLAEIHTTTSTLNPTDFRIIHHDFPEHVLFFFNATIL